MYSIVLGRALVFCLTKLRNSTLPVHHPLHEEETLVKKPQISLEGVEWLYRLYESRTVLEIASISCLTSLDVFFTNL